MSSKNIKLDLGQFARLIQRSPEDVRSLAERKASEGLWRFEAGQSSEAYVELPSSDLYDELEAAAGVCQSSGRQSSRDTTSSVHTPEKSMDHLKQENKHLRSLLEKSVELIEEIKDNVTSKEAYSDCDSRSGHPTNSFSATKAELVRAYDRIIDLQRQLSAAQKKENVRLLEENKMVVYLKAILARLDATITDTRDD